MTIENYLAIVVVIFLARVVGDRAAWRFLLFANLALAFVIGKNIYQAVA